jgi:membrane protease YdiL (CAAX protease family)
MEAVRIPLRVLALATIAVMVVEMLARWIIARNLAPLLMGIGVARMLDIALILTILRVYRVSWPQIGLGRDSWRNGLLRGLWWSAGFGAAAAVSLIGAHLIGFDLLRLLRPPSSVRDNAALFFLVGAFIAPLAEEIYFRGLLFGCLRRWGFGSALIVSTAIFAALHPGAAAIPFTQIIGGIVFAVAYEREKSLLVPISIHVLGNLVIFSLVYI